MVNEVQIALQKKFYGRTYSRCVESCKYWKYGVFIIEVEGWRFHVKFWSYLSGGISITFRKNRWMCGYAKYANVSEFVIYKPKWNMNPEDCFPELVSWTILHKKITEKQLRELIAS